MDDSKFLKFAVILCIFQKEDASWVQEAKRLKIQIQARKDAEFPCVREREIHENTTVWMNYQPSDK